MPEKTKSLEQMMEESDRVLMKYANIQHQLQIAQMLVESLDTNGASQTLQMLLSLSDKEKKARDMLVMFPALVTIQVFFKRIPNYEVDAETFEYLIKQGVHFI